MNPRDAERRLEHLIREHLELVERKNSIDEAFFNGLLDRYRFPFSPPQHTPLFWRYDLDTKTNPS
jgi:4-O-beta-D-mannosyl-D-glucose phosphorylase